MNLIFVTEVPTPYRTPLFDRLAQEESIDLHVLYCSTGDRYRGPLQDISTYAEVLPGRSLGGRTGGMEWKVNPSVWRRLSELRPDVVVIGGYAHLTMQIAVLWCRAKRVPYVLHTESNDLIPKPAWRRAIKAPAVRWAVSGAKAFLPVGSAAAGYLEKRGADPARMFIVPNAPDVEAISARARQAPDGSTARFIFVGRLVEVKDPATLVEAFASAKEQLPDATLTVIGEGPMRADLEAFCLARGIEGVVFLGFMAHDDVVAEYGRHDCFVLPSTHETYGVVVLEAMAAGLPVVVSDGVGSAPDLVMDGQNGFVFRRGNATDLANKLVGVMQGDRTAMGERSRTEASKWTYGSGVRRVMDAAAVARGRT